MGGKGPITSDEKLLVELADLKTSAKGLTNTADTFEQLFDNDMAQESATEPNRYAEQLKNSRGNTFSKWSRVNEWQPVTEEEVYIVLALFFANGYCTEAQCETVFVTKSTCSHASFWFSHCTGQI